MKNIQNYKFDGEGYLPFLISDKWQIAYLNYAPTETLESITKLDIHHHTDETFTLLRGKATLIGANIENGKVEYELIDMKENVTYNIPQNMWHKIALWQNAQVLIVENANTHLGDFEFYDLNKDQINELRLRVNNLMK